MAFIFRQFQQLNDYKADWICIACLSLAWISAIILVNPAGDFPLADDWAYGAAVRTLVDERDLHLSDWTATNLVAQVFWGALFCLPTGFSFAALRISTLTLGLVGVLATYGLLREVGVSPWLALFGSLVLGFSPIYFCLSFTFMTDVPFVAVATASSWLLLRGLGRDSGLSIVCGLVLAGVAILIRQVGLAIPFAFAPAYIFRYGMSTRRIFNALLPPALGIGLQIGFEAWLRWSDRVPAAFGRQIHTLLTQLQRPWWIMTDDAVAILTFAFVYTGFFLFAFLIALQRILSSRRSAAPFWLFAGISAATTAALAIWGKLMPLHGNILHRGGLGCCDDDSSRGPSSLWILVTFIGVFGAILLAIELGRSMITFFNLRTKGADRHALAFALVAIIFTFAPIPFLGLGYAGFYDRYLLVFLPWLMLVVSLTRYPLRVFQSSLVAGMVVLVGTSAFSIAATHDYLEASRIRWLAINTLLQDGVSLEHIDGGFEYGGWYLFNNPAAHHERECCYWVVNNDYIIQDALHKEYSLLAVYPINHWLPWRRDALFVQRRTGS
jgi:hypothetical protein